MGKADSGVDAEGLIHQLPRVPFQAEYRALLAVVRCQLPARLGRHLVAR